MAVGRLYCTLEDTKRILRSLLNRESRIRFSSAYRNLSSDSGNTGTISLSGVSFKDEFAEHETYTFEFTDSTSFDVTGDVVGDIGSGTVTSEFEASGRFSIPVSNWSGSANTGDKVYITSASDMSNDDGHDFVADATKKINSKLGSVYGDLSNVSFSDSTSEEIPDAISFACSRYAAYFIFNSVFAGMNTANDESPVKNWKTEADEAINDYLSGKGSGPRWRSRSIRVQEIGIEGINDGIIEIDDLTDAKNKEYFR